MIRTALLLLVLCPVAFAQLEEGQPLSNGIVSLIEDSFNPDATDPRRMTPFVEMIDTAALEVCKEQGLDSPECPTFEYSVPFVPRQLANNVENAVVDAWLRYETRTTHHVLLEIGAHKGILACLIGALDLRWLMYKDQLFVPPDEFCDAGFNVIPNCFLECDIPLGFCPSPPVGCNDCVARGVVKGQEHALTNYYPDYLADVLQAIGVNLPLALHWQSPLSAPAGATIAPVMDISLPLEEVHQVAREATQNDPRAYPYFFQAGAYNNYCLPVIPDDVLAALRRLPGETLNPETPGIPELEAYKRDLASRESAGDTWQRFDTWWRGKEEIYPKYDRGGAGFTGSGAPSTLALATPTFYACTGYAPFIQVYQKMDTIVKPLPGFQRIATCLKAEPPFVGLTVAPPVPIPFTFAGPRFHTDWVSVPEGYDISRVQGEPLELLPTP